MTSTDCFFLGLLLLPFAVAAVFAWLGHKARHQWHSTWSPPPNHLRDRSGCTTPDLLQAIAGISLLICWGLILAACLSDDPRW